MKKTDEQEIARYLLKFKEAEYSIIYALRRNKVLYGIQIAVFLGLLIVFYTTDDFRGLSLWAIGVLMGAFSRDFGWFLKIKKSWPFNCKITNWQMVEVIAEGKESANNASECELETSTKI